MNIGRLFRIALLILSIVLGWMYVQHYDAYQLPTPHGGTVSFLDPTSGETFKESQLEGYFFRFALAALITVIVYPVFGMRIKRIAL